MKANKKVFSTREAAESYYKYVSVIFMKRGPNQEEWFTTKKAAERDGHGTVMTRKQYENRPQY